MEPIDMHELKARGPNNKIEALRIELYDKVNALGIGAQGLGGLTTVLDVKILDYPTHAASLPVAMIPNCAATRHAHFTLDGSVGRGSIRRPSIDWPDVTWAPAPVVTSRELRHRDARRHHAGWGSRARRHSLNGKILTGRDAAHKRIADLFASGNGLPAGVDFTNRFIYYVGPVDPVRDEVIGPAGPTTATRMDKFTEMMLENGPARHDRQGRARAGRHRGHQATKPSISWPSAAPRIWCPRRSALRGSSRSPIWAWRPSTSSTWRTCRSPSPWMPTARRCIKPARRMASKIGKYRSQSRISGRDISMAGRPALSGSESGQVRKEATTAKWCKCQGKARPPNLR